MKKFLSAILCVAVLAGFSVGARAADCEHDYTLLSLDADCMNKARTVYTCSLCGDSYCVYADEYSAPAGLYFLLESTKIGDIISVRCYCYNNIGLSVARMVLSYDGTAVSAVSVENGTVWDNDAYVNGISWGPEMEHATFFAEVGSSNTNNGLCFTVNFKVTDAAKDPGFYLENKSRYFVDWDSENNCVVDRAPEMINITGKSDLGGHIYVTQTTEPTCTENGETTETCTVCGDTHTEVLEPLGHSFTRGFCIHCDAADPDAHTVTVDGNPEVYSVGDTVQLNGEFYTDGAMAYRFIRWEGDTDVLESEVDGKAIFAMPQRDISLSSVYVLVGDANGDGRVNGTDLNYLKRIITGNFAATDSVDINCDGSVNGTDSNFLCRMLLGNFIPNK